MLNSIFLGGVEKKGYYRREIPSSIGRLRFYEKTIQVPYKSKELKSIGEFDVRGLRGTSEIDYQDTIRVKFSKKFPDTRSSKRETKVFRPGASMLAFWNKLSKFDFILGALVGRRRYLLEGNQALRLTSLSIELDNMEVEDPESRKVK